MTPESRPLRVAIVGGGCAGMTAAFELTRPSQRGRYSVTVFQNGWRLGGKGASGRGPAGRIEEHGLHVWMGYYENAFRLMRDCYSELGRPKGNGPVSVEEAFSPANFVATSDRHHDDSWVPWAAHFPPQPGLPGSPTDYRRLSVVDYLTRAVQLVRALFETFSTEPEKSGADPAESTSSEQLAAALRRLASLGVLAGLGSAIEALRLLEAALSAAPEQSGVLLRALDLVKKAAEEQLERHVRDRGELRRLWDIVDLFLATIRGSIRFNLGADPRGFDAIDDYDCREWLRLNGASERSIDSPFVRALYDLAFAYEAGDIDKPRIAAGAALRGSLRAFFTYRGAFFWKMNGGMGDIVFAPLYEVLMRRGVRFAFFHRLRDVRTARDESGDAFVEELDFDVQAEFSAGTEYLPLVHVGGMPSWPSQPLWDQLNDGSRLRAEDVDFESHWETRRERSMTLSAGKDFDFVILAVGVGALPHVCSQMIEENARFRSMVEHVASVPTKAFQLWLEPTMDHFGWPGEAVSLSGFLPPFDTWADMSHLAAFEQWPRRPGAIAYFCSVLADTGVASADDARAARDSVRKAAIEFMNGPLTQLWPAARQGFPWNTLLLHPENDGQASNGPERFASQFWTANVNPSDRYTLALPGTIRHRISPLARSYENLTLAGDWTACGLNLGCVEAAVMSGMLAAHAISKSPPLEEIVGFDHP